MTDRVLVVCTANRCRSRMGEALLAHHAAEIGWDLAVASAGTRADGAPVMPDVEEVLAKRGLPITDRMSRAIAHDVLDASDVILVMEQAHLLEVVQSSPAAGQRAFRWAELAALDLDLARAPGEPLRDWVAARNAARPPGSVLALDRSHDVGDPTGRGRRAHRKTLERLDAEARRLAQLLSGVSTPANG